MSVFANQQRCMSFWAEEIEEWTAGGAREAESLEALRDFVRNDQDSSLSSAIRQTWFALESHGPPARPDRYGAYTERELSRVLIAFRDAMAAGEHADFAVDCAGGGWLEGSLGDYYIRSAKPAWYAPEFGDPEKWVSPDAERWLSYWLMAPEETKHLEEIAQPAIDPGSVCALLSAPGKRSGKKVRVEGTYHTDRQTYAWLELDCSSSQKQGMGLSDFRNHRVRGFDRFAAKEQQFCGNRAFCASSVRLVVEGIVRESPDSDFGVTLQPSAFLEVGEFTSK